MLDLAFHSIFLGGLLLFSAHIIFLWGGVVCLREKMLAEKKHVV